MVESSCLSVISKSVRVKHLPYLFTETSGFFVCVSVCVQTPVKNLVINRLKQG